MTLFFASVVWLLLLFGVARLAETNARARAWSEHPVVYGLSLGVYATSWTYFGAVGAARTSGLDFLAVSLGPTLTGLLIPVVSLPLLEVLRRHQLASLADLLAFRYRSTAVGAVATLTLVLALVAYVAVQIRGVASTATALRPELPPRFTGALFCLAMLLFAALFGARHAARRERHPGMVLAIATETVFKLVALLAVGAAALLTTRDADVSWPTLRETPAFPSVVILSAMAALLLPRQFHMTFTEAPEGEAGRRGLRASAWLFPLVLLLLNLPIPLILAVGTALDPAGNADLYVLTVARQVPGLPVLAWLGGVSASSAMVIVSSLALSNMVATHWVTPLRAPGGDLYRRLVLERRLVIAALLGLAFLLFMVLEATAPAASSRGGALAQLGLVSFAGVAQTLPGLVGVFVLKRLSRAGVVAGLLVGTVAWLVLLVLPLFGATVVPLASTDGLGVALWTSLALNVAAAALGSVLRPPTRDEDRAADACRHEVVDDESGLPRDQAALVERLTPVLGAATAALEVARARAALGISQGDDSPASLLKLRRRLEAELTRLLGPMVAWAALHVSPREEFTRGVPLAERIRSLEEAVAAAREGEANSAAETLRAWLETVFRALPVGVAVLGPDADVVWWNERMATLLEIPEVEARGRLIASLPGPVAAALSSPGEHTLTLPTGPRTLRVAVAATGEALEGARVVVVEDLTATRRLESQVRHQDRLATIGRFAAGVAHEVGNPLAAILMLAQGMKHDGDGEAERVEGLLDAGRRIDGIVRGLVAFARTGASASTRHEAVAPDAIAHQAVSLVQLSKKRTVGLELSAEDAVVDARAAELVQVLVNLLANAIDATPAGQRVTLRTRTLDDAVLFEVEDEGAGMSPEVAAHAFEPFFTTKDVGQGTGLGLSVAWSIVEAHGGQLSVKSAPGAGTTMTVRLPRARP